MNPTGQDKVCKHDFESNEDSEYCTKGCGTGYGLHVIETLANKIKTLQEENKKLKDILVNDEGICAECVTARLGGATVCGDCAS